MGILMANNGKNISVPLMQLDKIKDGGFAEIEVILDHVLESMILYRNGASVCAWRNICPHAGRRLDWAPGEFLKSKQGFLVCAAHGASFELQNGRCVSGPCQGASLQHIAIMVRDGAVFLE